MKNQYLWFLLIFLLVVSSCDLEESPVATTTKQEVFGTETGLRLYANSFYNYMPSGNAIVTEAYLSDINARDNRHIFLTEGAFGPTSSTAGWEWGALRNINYFLENNNHPDVNVSVRRHFNGLARFWRAWFYFDKVVQFGDVPWINIPLDVSDEKLYGGRDPRALVMDSVLADLDYAIAHITGGDPSRTLVTRNVALAMKSRICLVEASYRKYFPELGLANTANAWYEQSAAAAKELMDGGAFSLYTGAGTEMSYRQLFISQAPVASEIIFGRAFDINYNMNHAANWHYHSSTFGVRLSTIRTFINTYLMLDGTPFTEVDGYETMVFSEEVKERDKRLQQTIIMGDYTRISAGRVIPGPPNFGYTLTGYHPIKWSLDDVYYDGDTRNDNFISILRYGEVLLNYAEAKAELGTLTDAEWAQTIGALRSRAGITGGLNVLPTVVDSYMQQTFFPGITDPVILEVRRERGIELYLEVSRFTDIRRWRRGELMEMDYNGIYVPAVNQYMDLNEDGIPDVYFYHGDPPPADDRTAGVYYINVSPGSDRRLSNNTSGELKWLDALPRKWEDKMYLYPIPEAHRIVNPNLGQNPGW
jgi:starch-binding outer membrane protein, SusD/RagB family